MSRAHPVRHSPRRRLAPLAAVARAGGGATAALAPGAGAVGHVGSATVTGRLSRAGYTIVALGTNGAYSSSRARAFSLRTPAAQYTLQLIAPNGRYAGPVVVGGSATRAVVGLKGAAHLGTVVVNPAKGDATLATRLASKFLVPFRYAFAKAGVPIGNGRNFGFVNSPVRAGGPSGPGGDTDRDGVPNILDIASKGTLVLDALSTSSASGARLVGHVHAAVPPPAVSPGSQWMSQLFLSMDATVNEDATAITAAAIDATLSSSLNLKLLSVATADRVELDCNGLSFCSGGGTGEAQLEGLALAPGSGRPATVAFPAGALDPETGLGEIVGPDTPNGLLGSVNGREFSLDPHATTAQIGSGDVITELVTSNGATVSTPTTLDFVFTTVPAISAYADTAGDSGTITYPDVSGLGTSGNPIHVAAGPNGDVVVTFTVFRPQRAGIAGAGEPAFMDIGNLWYALDSVSGPATPSNAGSSFPQCAASAYGTPSTTLKLVDGAQAGTSSRSPGGTGMLVDTAGDQPASAANTIAFTIDLSSCMADKGQSFPIGQPVMFDISANSQNSSDHANQTFWLERTA